MPPTAMLHTLVILDRQLIGPSLLPPMYPVWVNGFSDGWSLRMKALGHFDQNGDGSISFDEFCDFG